MPSNPRSSPSTDTPMSESSRESKKLARRCNDPNLAPSQWATNVANLALHTDLTGLATAKPLNILTSDVLKHVAARPGLIWELRDVMYRVINSAICPDILLALGEWHKGKSKDDLFRGQLQTNLADEHMILLYLQAQALRQTFSPDSKRRTDTMYKIMRKMCERHDSITPFDIKDFGIHDLYKPRLVDKKPINRTADFTFISRLESTHHRTLVELYRQVTDSRLPFNPIHDKILSFIPMCGGVVVREGDSEIIRDEAALHINTWHAATVLHMRRLCRYVRMDYSQHPAPPSLGLKIVNDTWTVSAGYVMAVEDEDKLCIEDIAEFEVGLGNVAGIYMALHALNAIIEYFKLFYLPWLTNFVIPSAIKTFSNHGTSRVPRISSTDFDEPVRQARSSSVSSGLWSMMKIQSREEAERESTRWHQRGGVQGDAHVDDSHGLMLASEYDVLGCGSGFGSTFQSF